MAGASSKAVTALVATGSGHSTWATKAVPSGVDALSDLRCPSPTHCYAVGQFGNVGLGLIIGSSDGGRLWKTLVRTSQAVALLAIACPSASTCVVGGETNPNDLDAPPEAFVTTDYGAYWTSALLPVIGGVAGVACASLKVCLIIGVGGIARTTNGGRSWYMVPGSRRLIEPASVTCSNGSFCIVGGTGSLPNSPGPSAVSVSHDAGATWSKAIEVAGPMSVPGGGLVDTALGAISCSDAVHCLGLIESQIASVFGTGSPVVSSDGGKTWTRRSGRVGDGLSCVGSFCMSVGFSLVGRDPHRFVKRDFLTTDGGLDWRVLSVPGPQILTTVGCTSSTHCVAASGNLPPSQPAVIMMYS